MDDDRGGLRDPAGRVARPRWGHRRVRPGQRRTGVGGQHCTRRTGVERPCSTSARRSHPLLATRAVLLATMLGTMGLPHVIMRFHTSPDGRAARRTAALTVALLGGFYSSPVSTGCSAAYSVPHLYLSGSHRQRRGGLAGKVDPGPLGGVFTGLLTAGAFAAFLATSLGLLLVVAGAISHDLVPGGLRHLRMTVVGLRSWCSCWRYPPCPSMRSTLVDLGIHGGRLDVLPLLVLGIWWSRLTAGGAIAGVTSRAARLLRASPSGSPTHRYPAGCRSC